MTHDHRIRWRRHRDGHYVGSGGYTIHPAPSGLTIWDPRTPDGGSLRACSTLKIARLQCDTHRRRQQ